MSYLLSRHDIRSLKVLYKMFNLLSITPSYDFDQFKICHPVFDKTKTVATMIYCTFILSIAFLVLGDDFYTYRASSIKSHILMSLSNITVALLALSALWKSLCHEKWTKLNSCFQLLDEKLHVRNRKSGFVGNVYVHYCLYMVVHFIIQGLMCYLIYGHLKGFQHVFYVMYGIIMFHTFHVYMLIYNVTQALACRYKELYKLLHHFPKNAEKIPGISLILHETVAICTDLFGWPLVFIVGKCVISMLDILSTLEDPAFLKNFDQAMFFFAVLSFTCFMMLMTVMVIMSCDEVKVESKKITVQCDNMTVMFGDKRHKQSLAELAVFMRTKQAEITAADFFVVDKKTLVDIAGLTTTYFIVSLQFK